MLLFGEGTAGDGNRVLPFRTALIGAARDAIASAEHVTQVWIQPLSIAYVSQHGIPLGRHLRPRAAWYGKMKLDRAYRRHRPTGAVDVSVTWGEPIAYDGATDRKALARQLESSVRERTVAALRGDRRRRGAEARRAFQLAAKGAKTEPRRRAGHKISSNTGIA